MKYLIYLYYFLRSLILRGPVNSIQMWLKESRYEEKFNIRTAEFIKSDSKEYFHYQGASYLVLLRLFHEIGNETKGFHFVDIGSGKGRAVFVAEYCGFDSLSGIELNNDLVNMAQKNLETYSHKKPESQIHFIQANALEFEYKNEPTVYFLFNPFNGAVLGKVLEKIKKNSKSETWFVYMNPLYASVFEEFQIKKVKTIRSGFYKEAIIYKILAEEKK